MSTGKGIVLALSIFIFLLISALSAAVFFSELDKNTPVIIAVPSIKPPAEASDSPREDVVATSSLWLLGDVMLSRQVGERMLTRGADFPWSAASSSFIGSYVLANFESCISDTTSFDYLQSMRFPVRSTIPSVLSRNGITHVSLANNHALDCGASDLASSRMHFSMAGITSFGHPVSFSSSSVSFLELGTVKVALIGLHTLFYQPTEDELAAVITPTLPESDLQLVFVHWGDEYTLTASANQKALVQILAGLGVDIIIGHHPHVVQPIERHDNTLVLYSLGNFIFDQYFSEAVQSGLTARLESRGGLSLSLHPVTSAGTQNQPHFTTGTSTNAFLDMLARNSDARLQSQIRAGNIDLSFLASSTDSAIITQ